MKGALFFIWGSISEVAYIYKRPENDQHTASPLETVARVLFGTPNQQVLVMSALLFNVAKNQSNKPNQRKCPVFIFMYLFIFSKKKSICFLVVFFVVSSSDDGCNFKSLLGVVSVFLSIRRAFVVLWFRPLT